MGHKILTSSRTLVLLFIKLRIGAELAAQIDIRNYTLVLEMRSDVAFCTGEVG